MSRSADAGGRGQLGGVEAGLARPGVEHRCDRRAAPRRPQPAAPAARAPRPAQPGRRACTGGAPARRRPAAGSASVRPRRPSAGGGPGASASVGVLGEALLDHLERQEVVALLGEDPPQPLDVGVVELPVARRRALGVEQPLALEEADLRDRDVGELVLQQVEHLADREVRRASRRFGPASVRSSARVERQLVTCRSGPRRRWRAGPSSTRSPVEVGAVEASRRRGRGSRRPRGRSRRGAGRR